MQERIIQRIVLIQLSLLQEMEQERSHGVHPQVSLLQIFLALLQILALPLPTLWKLLQQMVVQTQMQLQSLSIKDFQMQMQEQT